MSGAKKQVSVGSPFSQTSLNSSPIGQRTPPHTHSPRRSSSPVGPPVPSSSGILLSGLSTVSLDSPPVPEEVVSKYVINNAGAPQALNPYMYIDLHVTIDIH